MKLRQLLATASSTTSAAAGGPLSTRW